MAAARAEWSDRVRGRIADYLRAQTELHKYPAPGFDQIFQKADLLPSFVRRWEDYLHEARRRLESYLKLRAEQERVAERKIAIERRRGGGRRS